MCSRRCASAPCLVLELALSNQLQDLLRCYSDIAQVAMHEDLRQSTPCRVVFDALVQGLSAHVSA